MATFVETPDVRILIDPSAALGKRFGLFPHPEEYKAVRDLTEEIIRIADKCDILTISHYHWDHFKPFFENYTFIWSNEEIATSIYDGKTVLAKDFRSRINFSQRVRGYVFNKMASKVAGRIEVADGRVFTIGDTKIAFSPPFWHGPPNTALGYVLCCSVEYDGEVFIHAPDVQGPVFGETLDYILSRRPQLVYVGGPPLYLKGFRFREEDLEKALKNMSALRRASGLVVDHHLLRDGRWREWCSQEFDPVCAADYEGKEARLLEARRRELYKEEPPDEDFVRWTKMPAEKRRITVPPI